MSWGEIVGADQGQRRHGIADKAQLWQIRQAVDAGAIRGPDLCARLAGHEQ
jgi:hypothetical protein